MAVIGKIRENSTLLLIVVGGALMAFILTDLFSSRGSVFGSDLENIGSIDGKDIRGVDFNNKYEKELENYKTRQKTTDVPEFVQGQLRDQVWNQYLNDYILGKELSDLGIEVSVEELGDMAYGDNPHAQVRQAFTNPETGIFNKNDVINFLKNMDRDETGKTKAQWLVFERAMKEERKMNKYYTLIRKGLYTTNQEALESYTAQNKKMSISFIAKRFADIPDSTVKVSEADLKKFYEENSHRFIEKKSRKLEYAMFHVVPSSEDSAVLKAWVDKTFAKFKVSQNDSNFVNANSDREFDFRFYSKGENNSEIDSNLYNDKEAGFVVEPKIVGEGWKMSKISKIKFAPDSVEARHILLSFEKDDKKEVRAQIDSLKTALQNGADFATLAKEFSVDPGSKEDGGKLGWFVEGFMIPVINDSCFKAEVNKLMVVESPFGLHLIEVVNKSPVVKKLQVAIIFRSLDASRETVDGQFTKSNDFSLSITEDTDMRQFAEKYGVPYNDIDIRENDNMIPEIPSSRGLIRWAYNAEIGQVSEALLYDGSIFVVARLLEVHEDGVAPLDNVRPAVELGAIKDKKAEMYKEEMKGYTDLDNAAKGLGLKIEKADGVIFDSYSVPALGREPALLGRIYTMNEGDLSVPIKGANGVFIVRVDQVESPEATNDLSATKAQVNQNRTSRVNYEVFEALKERVEIKDNRYRIY